ncbi:hypothetical protein BESB_018940 [Besnoitia besnoiti]|uniref:Uncharacterized protein n=1 Tax=Besnoitia besnoiti TaxID=94643 RepID=A0A2A9M5P6_BESBE|nr:uncharacterized protein BESB_018940 [Besnoitia besnoiti]PFH30740.1 hypothetical protein BESB_018940 [Besnoitia besnoiti]
MDIINPYLEDLEGLCLPDPSSLVLFMTIMLSALSIVVSSVYLKNQHLYTSCTNIMTFTLVVAFLMLVSPPCRLITPLLLNKIQLGTLVHRQM